MIITRPLQVWRTPTGAEWQLLDRRGAPTKWWAICVRPGRSIRIGDDGQINIEDGWALVREAPGEILVTPRMLSELINMFLAPRHVCRDESATYRHRTLPELGMLIDALVAVTTRHADWLENGDRKKTVTECPLCRGEKPGPGPKVLN